MFFTKSFTFKFVKKNTPCNQKIYIEFICLNSDRDILLNPKYLKIFEKCTLYFSENTPK